jgi:GT2 family glycosyltransferase
MNKPHRDAPRVSVIVVTHNSRAVIGRCLESIRSHVGETACEIVVADNASTDGTATEVSERFPDVRVLHLRRNAGLSAAINAGVAASTGAFIMQLNPDTHVHHDALSPLIAYLESHPDVGIVAPRLLNEDGSLQLSCRAFPGFSTALFNRYSVLTRVWPSNPISKRYLMTGFDHELTAAVDWVSGAALMYRREVHDRLGGWDAGFFLFNEDVDLCKRVHKAGLRVVYLPEATVYHAIGISERPTRRAIIERHRSMWRYYRKHLRRSSVWDVVVAPGIAIRALFALAKTALRRK